MKISIENFKSIKLLRNFEIKPITVISGVNSSGKSSFIQSLLLLKQTIKLDSSSKPFYLDGELYKVRKYKDIIYNKDFRNKLEVSFEFCKNEVMKINNPMMAIFNHHDDYKVIISIQFDFVDDNIIIRKFSIEIKLPKDSKDQIIKLELKDGDDYSINTNTGFFSNGLFIDTTLRKVGFLSFYPSYFFDNKTMENKFFNIDWVKALINSYFNNIFYIGPLRDQPKDEYTFPENYKNVGTKGENVSQILEEFAVEQTEFYRIIEHENDIIYEKETKSLIDAVNYWMCEVFDMTRKIYTKKLDDAYKIILVNNEGLEISIKHVGFGISQLLPIIVEGLRMPRNGTLIIEQPENHLHPKIHSLLFDYLYGLTKLGKTIIIETHSSHFITRMRRRIAEDESNELDNHINLTFIENNNYRTIKLDDYGTLDYFPEDFIEQQDKELRAIIKAQMNKRTKNK